MIENFDKNDGFKVFSLAVFAMFGVNVVYSLLVSVVPTLNDGAGFWCVNVVLQAALVGVVALYCRKKNISMVSAAKMRVKPRAVDLLVAAGLVLALLAFMLPVQNWILDLLEKAGMDVESQISTDSSVVNVILLLVVACALPSFCEELVFRGALGNGLAEAGLWRACLIGGALFSVFHMSPMQTAHQFVMGFLLMFLLLSTGSLWTAVAAHFLNNTVTVLLTLTLGDKIDAASIEYWYVFMAAGAAVFAPLFWLSKKRSRFVAPADSGCDSCEKSLTLIFLLPALFVCVLFWVVRLFQ